MLLPGSRDQQRRDHLYDLSGTIAVANVAQLLLPERKSCSFLFIQNNSASDYLWIEFGGARATATISGGQVASCAITNGGFGFLQPPVVRFWGGGTGGNATFAGVGMPDWPAPGDAGFTQPRYGSVTARPAKAHAVLTGGVVSSIVIDDPGSGYVAAPFVFLENSLEPPDPFGAANPYYGSVNSGLQLFPNGGNFYVNGTHCTTDQISIWGPTMGDPYMCKFAP